LLYKKWLAESQLIQHLKFYRVGDVHCRKMLANQEWIGCSEHSLRVNLVVRINIMMYRMPSLKNLLGIPKAKRRL
jgi:hypothetical protein